MCHFSGKKNSLLNSSVVNPMGDGSKRSLSRSVFDVLCGQNRINNPNPSKMLSYDRIFLGVTYLHIVHCLLLSGDISLVDKFQYLRQPGQPQSHSLQTLQTYSSALPGVFMMYHVPCTYLPSL